MSKDKKRLAPVSRFKEFENSAALGTAETRGSGRC